MLTLYLDTCSYNRLFDDRSIVKNYLERETIILILQLAYESKLKIVSSEVLDVEISVIPDIWRLDHVVSIYNGITTEHIQLGNEHIERAKQFEKTLNTKPFDSLHLALAESHADYMITTDQKLINAAKRSDILINVDNPISFIRNEVIDNDTNN